MSLNINGLVTTIVRYVDLVSLGKMCGVSKLWNEIASDPNCWKRAIYKEIAFGNDKWIQHCGRDVIKDESPGEDWLSLPLKTIISNFRLIKSVFPDKTPRDSLMLVRLPEGMALKSIDELAKKQGIKLFRQLRSSVSQAIGDKVIQKSRWVLMTKEILPLSEKDRAFSDHQERVKRLASRHLAGYEVPETLEAVICIWSQFMMSKTRLFGGESITYTSCKEIIGDNHMAIGHFTPAGLFVDDLSPRYTSALGVAAIRNLSE